MLCCLHFFANHWTFLRDETNMLLIIIIEHQSLQTKSVRYLWKTPAISCPCLNLTIWRRLSTAVSLQIWTAKVYRLSIKTLGIWYGSLSQNRDPPKQYISRFEKRDLWTSCLLLTSRDRKFKPKTVKAKLNPNLMFTQLLTTCSSDELPARSLQSWVKIGEIWWM